VASSVLTASHQNLIDRIPCRFGRKSILRTVMFEREVLLAMDWRVYILWVL
jgi:hypothetical protein